MTIRKPNSDVKINLVSQHGDGAGLGVRLQQEGFDVKLFIQDASVVETMDGLVPKADSFIKMVETADAESDVFIFDTTGMGVQADWLRSKGFPVFGSSVFADKLEFDRAYGTEVMTDCGIKVPRTWSFKDWDKAKEFVESNPEIRLVFKPCGEMGAALSHVSYDTEDMLEYLEHVRPNKEKEPDFELQEFLKGVALSTEAWFDGRDFLPGMWNHTLERKQLMDGDLGPSGGCSGNVIWACGDDCPICANVGQLKGFLAGAGYVGMIDLNAVVREDGVFGLEFTPRFGYDATPTLLLELFEGSIGDFLIEMAHGAIRSEARDAGLKDGFAAGLRISIPPYPFSGRDVPKGIPLRGIPRSLEHVFLYYVKADEGKDDLRSVGDSGEIAILTGLGDSIEEAFKGPHQLAKKLKIPDKQYRLDLATGFQDDYRKITKAARALAEA